MGKLDSRKPEELHMPVYPEIRSSFSMGVISKQTLVRVLRGSDTYYLVPVTMSIGVPPYIADSTHKMVNLMIESEKTFIDMVYRVDKLWLPSITTANYLDENKESESSRLKKEINGMEKDNI